jgi:hypothetical protein
MKALWKLIWPMLACLLLPLAAAWFAYPATHLPPKFGIFPPEFVQQAPSFNLLVFCAVLVVEAVAVVFLLYPGLFGFKTVQPPPPAKPARFPVWFWLGAVLMLFFWWLMWARVTPFGDLVYYAFTPMWWGFILVLDGLTYRRSGGKSLLATKPKTLFISALVSVGGWCFFEYFDYFVLSNWYYPNGHMPELSHATIVLLFMLAYTTVWPAIFEWYTLLKTFPKLAVRYSDGPKLPLPGKLLMWGGLGLIVLMVFLPYPLFWVMWIGPLSVLAGLLICNNVWTPFTAMAQGNWGPLLLVALSSLFNGFFWEVWNYGSAHPDPALQTNPNYWIYEIPYVNVIHIFAEMPLLGYFGYLPFGILVWVFFIWASKVFGFDSDLNGK